MNHIWYILSIAPLSMKTNWNSFMNVKINTLCKLHLANQQFKFAVNIKTTPGEAATIHYVDCGNCTKLMCNRKEPKQNELPN